MSLVNFLVHQTSHDSLQNVIILARAISGQNTVSSFFGFLIRCDEFFFSYLLTLGCEVFADMKMLVVFEVQYMLISKIQVVLPY